MSYIEDRNKRKLGILPPLPTRKQKRPIAKISQKKKAKNKFEKGLRNGNSTDLQKWYEKIMNSEKNKCWETEEWIDKYEDIIVDGEVIGRKFSKGWHGSIAHILPKSLFGSVATHPKNYMVLNMWGGTHEQYDSSWLNASKMKVWSHCCKIINILYPILTDKENAKLPKIILDIIKI